LRRRGRRAASGEKGGGDAGAVQGGVAGLRGRGGGVEGGFIVRVREWGRGARLIGQLTQFDIWRPDTTLSCARSPRRTANILSRAPGTRGARQSPFSFTSSSTS
jgi:hypothetical protein